MEIYYKIHECPEGKFKFFLNFTNNDLLKKFQEINKNPKLLKKYILVIESIKVGVSNTTQFNYEGKCPSGDVYAIKIDSHRFYTLLIKEDNCKKYYISRYGKKQSQQNTKLLTDIINSICKCQIQLAIE